MHVLVSCMLYHNSDSQQTGSAHQVVQLHMTNWSPDGSCSHLATITSVINEMSAIQRRTGNHPITVHCRYANTDKWVVC